MRRGTTPTIKLKLTGIDIELLKDVFVTFQQGSFELTKTGDEVTIDTDSAVVKVVLTEEETLKFRANPAAVQIRAVTKDDSVIASTIKNINIGDVLYEEVIGE